MARGHVSDTFTPPVDEENASSLMPLVFSDEPASSPSEMSAPPGFPTPQASPIRFGRFGQVIAAQPAAAALREEVSTVLQGGYGAAISAASLMPGSSLVNVEDRVSILERLFAGLTCENGTIDHMFNAVNTLASDTRADHTKAFADIQKLQDDLSEMREEFDCRTSEGQRLDAQDSSVSQLGFVTLTEVPAQAGHSRGDVRHGSGAGGSQAQTLTELRESRLSRHATRDWVTQQLDDQIGSVADRTNKHR